jgi:aldehyde dehydrogenase (NAD+)
MNDLPSSTLAAEVASLLESFGVPAVDAGTLVSRSPIDGQAIARLAATGPGPAGRALDDAHRAFLAWREQPAPARGELVRLFADELRQNKAALGRLVSLENGKIASEGLGEVQEMIDICDFAAGLSRQLYGLTLPSERPQHRMMETWHPFGVTGIISAFNFPVAVWCWNAAIALVCGNATVWKPSDKTPLCALAAQALFDRARRRWSAGGTEAPSGLSAVLLGGKELAEFLADDPRVPLVSATGSTAMGKALAPRLAARFARAILELGGNNAAIVCPSADLELATRGITFAAAGTAGQRCTSLRRLFVHASIHGALLPRLQRAYASVTVGHPLEPGTLVGPLIGEPSFRAMQKALTEARSKGGTVTGGERVREDLGGGAYYVRPALVEMPSQCGPVLNETFAPILYVMRYDKLEDAIALNNAVSQGLSSSIFTNDFREAELFLSARGSDCGIANVNLGPSGAEIGGAFGGEKETGGGREAGSDAWKSYMRRATNTLNYGRELPLAQGVRFDLS